MLQTIFGISNCLHTFGAKSDMDTVLRKRFTSPFSISRASAEGNKHYPLASTLQRELSPIHGGQWSMPSLTPASSSRAEVSKSESLMSSNRSQENGLKSLDPVTESISERGSRQKVCRSLFSSKPTGCEQKCDLEQQSYLKKQAQYHKEDQGHSSSTSDLLGTSSKKTPILLAELSTPEILPEANTMNAAPGCLMHGGLTGLLKVVDVQCTSDFCDLLKPEAVEKFRSAITPTKAHLSPFTSSLDSSIDPVIICLDSQDSCSQNPRQPSKEKFVQMPTAGVSASCKVLTNNNSMSGDPCGATKSKKHHIQAPSLCDSMVSDMSSNKRRMIRGFSVPRCGRLTNQSYQEQAKEFQEILSSKVRQIAEVADCLQHTELLYKILEL
ncbi:hypothetical protein GOP47_0017486 [Adiantum capillus-veneris]|uniref:Uncharacterized protein n=1 Tax=Adiantum capillus-veneris TaxID=13818 RepID=A0A9D4UFE9_ADICA|nr:hypothetical protein GOP47_0017486 [Adiantum capillus-veneris]